MFFWRISNYADLSGGGGTIAHGRWHRRLRQVVYLASCSPGALIEALVHFDRADLPNSLQLLKIQMTASLEIQALGSQQSASGWASNLEVTQNLGDRWLDEGSAALAQVPSAIVPGAFNYLLNPAHVDAVKVHLVEAQRFKLDPRFF